ncbi:acid protease [Laetiporus sulphureus 93-53]|uniref:Acid protease n=1 Tax=Laetiporus sulphureus 93-53 TaxID=1314785 RepID=A0A165FH12_9APHY|nr:acid protease [Laetiporus sulphureus 93-53]KZT08959.1 acid protease [Laetiporus sulphureus 93-53]
MIPIPLLFDEYGRYVLGVGMSPGADEQHFNFTLSTSAGLTAVAGTGCSSCGGVKLYNESASDTAKSLDISDSLSFAASTLSGSLIKENCSLTAATSSWIYNNQTIVVAENQDNGTIVGNGVSGVIGLGTNRFSTSSESNSSSFTPNFSDSIYSQWLDEHPDVDSFQFGMDISSPVLKPTSVSSASMAASATATSSSAGTLHWLAPDTSAYNADQLTYKTVTTNSTVVYASSDSEPDWTVTLDSWKATSDNGGASYDVEFSATVDPYYTDIYFPAEQARLINDLISDSSVSSNLSSLGSQAEEWTVPCDAKFTVSFVINDQTFTLDQSVLISELSDGSCVSGIEGWTDPSVEEYLLGARFVSQVYIIFSVGRNGTDMVGFAPKISVKKGANIGAIVGGTIGGVAGVLLIAIAAFLYIRSRKDRAIVRNAETIVEEHKAANAVEPYTLGAPQASPMRSEFSYVQVGSAPGSPGLSEPLLGTQEDVAPPSYEASESAREEVGAAVGAAVRTRPEKAGYVRHTLASMQEQNEGAGMASSSANSLQ